MKRYLGDTNGATAIEYAMIAGFISILILVGVTSIGTTLKTFFQSVSSHL